MAVVDVVVPVVILVLAAALVVGSFVVRRPQPIGFPGWAFVVVLMIAAGDAAFGVGRPVWERSWKGGAVVLLGTALAVSWWRARRARAHVSGAGTLSP